MSKFSSTNLFAQQVFLLVMRIENIWSNLCGRRRKLSNLSC